MVDELFKKGDESDERGERVLFMLTIPFLDRVGELKHSYLSSPELTKILKNVIKCKKFPNDTPYSKASSRNEDWW